MRCRWPDGHDCAVAFAFDVDAESALIFREPERAARSLAANEERRFGVRTGVARILRLLERYGLRGTFYVPGWMVAHHTATIRPIRDAGHELAAHGNVHESLDTLDANEEVRVLEEQLDIWKACLDLRPSGYRSPHGSSTPGRRRCSSGRRSSTGCAERTAALSSRCTRGSRAVPAAYSGSSS